jgi:hypothetical protein
MRLPGRLKCNFRQLRPKPRYLRLKPPETARSWDLVVVAAAGVASWSSKGEGEAPALSVEAVVLAEESVKDS